jgi:5-methylcytosine-specific restriction endonuclease McrA
MFGRVVATQCVDHKIPKAKGGTDARDNLTGACKQCNDSKQDMTAQEFIRSEMQRQLRNPNV